MKLGAIQGVEIPPLEDMGEEEEKEDFRSRIEARLREQSGQSGDQPAVTQMSGTGYQQI